MLEIIGKLMISEIEGCQKYQVSTNINEKSEMIVIILPEKKMIIVPMSTGSLRRYTVMDIRQMSRIVTLHQVPAVITQVRYILCRL